MNAVPEGPDLGVGVGLRSVHYEWILRHRPRIPWFEATSENYMGIRGGRGPAYSADRAASTEDGMRRGLGGRPLEMLEKIRRDYPVMLHGVSLNIGSSDPLRAEYLRELKALADHIQPVHVSDHVCWTGVDGENLHDLLPLPYTEETLKHIVPRVRQVQEAIGRRLLLENVSSYLTYAHSEMTEWEFLGELSSRADCGLLLDVNNIYVSAHNHGFDPRDFLRGIPVERVGYMHLAGYSESESVYIDTHDHPVTPAVWDLFADAVRRFGAVPVLIEWDDNIPDFPVLQDEARKADAIRRTVLNAHEPLSVAS